jgi:hypothetical protein
VSTRILFVMGYTEITPRPSQEGDSSCIKEQSDSYELSVLDEGPWHRIAPYEAFREADTSHTHHHISVIPVLETEEDPKVVQGLRKRFVSVEPTSA